MKEEFDKLQRALNEEHLMDLEKRRKEFERDTGQPIRFMVPFTPNEILWGVLVILQMGFLVGYMVALHLFEKHLTCP